MVAKILALALLFATPLHAGDTELRGSIPGSLFGGAVATDGKVIAVSAKGEASSSGAVYVYAADTLALLARVTAPTPLAFELFGGSLDVDNGLLAVGATSCYRYGYTHPGRVYLFRGPRWTYERTLQATSPGFYDCYGISVEVDGGLVYVGSHLYEDSATGPIGSVYLHSADTGATVGQIRGHSGWDLFGGSLAADNDYLAVGAMGESAVYLYHAGTLLARLTAPTYFYGGDVALDGGVLVVGAAGEDTFRGAVHVYTKRTNWAEQQVFEGEQLNDWFGYRVAASRPCVVVGAHSAGEGAVYLLTDSGDRVARIPGNGGLGYAVDASHGVYVFGAPYLSDGAGMVRVVTGVDGR